MRWALSYTRDNAVMADLFDTYEQAESYMNELKAENAGYSNFHITKGKY